MHGFNKTTVLALLMGLVMASTGCQEELPLEAAPDFRALRPKEISRNVPGWTKWQRIEAVDSDQLIMGRHNWMGINDLGLLDGGIDVFGDTLTLVAIISDDRPLMQQYERLKFPLWWGTPIAGDCLEIRMTPLERELEPFEILLQLGQDGTNPTVVVGRSPKGEPGPMVNATLDVLPTPRGYEVALRAIKVDEGYGLLPLYHTAYRIEVIVHDVDGPPTTHTAIRFVTDSRP